MSKYSIKELREFLKTLEYAYEKIPPKGLNKKEEIKLKQIQNSLDLIVRLNSIIDKQEDEISVYRDKCLEFELADKEILSKNWIKRVAHLLYISIPPRMAWTYGEYGVLTKAFEARLKDEFKSKGLM